MPYWFNFSSLQDAGVKIGRWLLLIKCEVSNCVHRHEKNTGCYNNWAFTQISVGFLRIEFGHFSQWFWYGKIPWWRKSSPIYSLVFHLKEKLLRNNNRTFNKKKRYYYNRLIRYTEQKVKNTFLVEKYKKYTIPTLYF